MSDANTNAGAAALDPVAAARAKLAAEQTSSADEVQGLKRQVRALWVVTAVTLVLVIALGAFSIFGRQLGMGGRMGTPPTGMPGQFQQRGSAGDQGTAGQPTAP